MSSKYPVFQMEAKSRSRETGSKTSPALVNMRARTVSAGIRRLPMMRMSVISSSRCCGAAAAAGAAGLGAATARVAESRIAARHSTKRRARALREQGAGEPNWNALFSVQDTAPPLSARASRACKAEMGQPRLGLAETGIIRDFVHAGQSGAHVKDTNPRPRERLCRGFLRSGAFHFHQTRVKRGAGSDVGQLLRCEYVDVLALRVELGPVQQCRDHARLHGAIHFGCKAQFAATVERAHPVTVANAARGRVGGAELEHTVFFHGLDRRQIAEGSIQEIVGLATKQLQWKFTRGRAVTRLFRRNERRDGIEPLRIERFA